MRGAIGFLGVVVLFTGPALVQSTASTQPDVNVAPASEPRPLLILPFGAPSDGQFKDSGRGIQQDLGNAIAPVLRGRMLAPPAASPAADAAEALAAARKAQASAVIFGLAQVNGEQIRISGQVLEVASGKSLGSLKQTGPIASLFQLEDGLLPQVLHALPQSLLNLRGLLSSEPRQATRIINLPGDAPTSDWPSGPIDGGYAGPIAPYVLPPAPGGPPPYSPLAGSYPYRFTAPYAHLFSYDFDPDPFLPIYGGGLYVDRFAGRGAAYPGGGFVHQPAMARPAGGNWHMPFSSPARGETRRSRE